MNVSYRALISLFVMAVACSQSINGTFPSDSGSNFTRTSDTFNRANSANNPGAQTDAGLGGTAWPYAPILGGAVLGIASNELSINTLGGGSAAFLGIDTGKSGCDIEVTFGTISNGGQSGISFRSDLTGHLFMVVIDKGNMSPAGHYLYKFSGGGPAPVDDEATMPVDGETIRIEQTGTTINVLLNGNPTPILTATDADFTTNSLVGIGGIGDTTTTIDSWVVENCD